MKKTFSKANDQGLNELGDAFERQSLTASFLKKQVQGLALLLLKVQQVLRKPLNRQGVWPCFTRWATLLRLKN